MTNFDEEMEDKVENDNIEELEETSEELREEIEELDEENALENPSEMESDIIEEEITEEIETIEESDLDEVEIDESSDLIESETIEETGTSVLTEEDIEKQLREYQKNMIEASLYAAGKPLNVEILSTKLEVPKKIVAELINELAFDYLERSTALVIAQMGDSYQMQIKPEYTEKVSKFATGGAIAERYLRTLTVIALKQPILKSLLIKLRGSGAYEHVKYLLDNGLINAVKKGRSQELTTTEKYSQMFGLPTDREAMKQMMIAQLGLDEEGGVQGNEPELESQGDIQDIEPELEAQGDVQDIEPLDDLDNENQ